MKDLVDLARAWDVYKDEPDIFWHSVAEHFAIACDCRLVECVGWATFASLTEQVQEAWQADPIAVGSGNTFDDA